MYDKGKVLIGLLIFAAVFLSPFVYNIVAGHGAELPAPDLAPARQLSSECVEPTDWMIVNHMLLLDEWRDIVVRDGFRVYKSTTGKEFNMSLSNTCMRCHSNYLTFCNRCHSYSDVDPFCWDCHLNGTEE